MKTPLASRLVLFLLLWFTFGYFLNQEFGWNVKTRMDLTFAIVEHGTLNIDDYHDPQKNPVTWTNDKAFFQGHFYCDKPPAMSFTAVPLYAICYLVRDWFPGLSEMPYPQWVSLSIYVATLFTSALSAALLGCILLAIARRFGLSEKAGFVLGVGLTVGTVLAGYAALFYAYLPAALLSASAYLILLDARLKGGDALTRGPRLFWAGLLIGGAWFFDLTAGLSGLGLSLYALWSVRRNVVCLWKLAAGGAIPVILFAAYSYTLFGEFAIPHKYEYVELFRNEMAQGFEGIHLPRLTALYYLTIHPFKGLFFYSPFLVLAFAGLWTGLRGKASRKDEPGFAPDMVLALGMISAYLLYNSGYYMWWGGWAAGPRLLCPVIPYFVAPLALWLRQPTQLRAGLFGALLTVSLLLNFMILAVDPQIPTGIDNDPIMRATIADNLPSTVLSEIVPRFCIGEAVYEGKRLNMLSLNLGNVVLGWSGKTALLPLAAIWIAAAIWLACRKENGPARRSES